MGGLWARSDGRGLRCVKVLILMAEAGVDCRGRLGWMEWMGWRGRGRGKGRGGQELCLGRVGSGLSGLGLECGREVGESEGGSGDGGDGWGWME